LLIHHSKTMAKSIFKFGDKFGYESPFGDWRKEKVDKQNIEDEPPKILDVEVNQSHAFDPLNPDIVKVHFNISVSENAGIVKITYRNMTKTAKYNVLGKKYETNFDIVIIDYYKDCLFEVVVFDVRSNPTEKRSILRQITYFPISYPILEQCICKKNSLSAEDLKYIVHRLRQLEETSLGYVKNKKENSNWLYIHKKTGEIKPSKPNGDPPSNDYEVYKIQQTLYDEDGDKLFFLKSNYNVDAKYQNYVHFAKFLNLIFTKYKINTCLRKIHFLAQVYTESDRFRRTYETDGSAAKSGEDFYRGRGLIQVTKKGGYIDFYEYLFKKKPTEAQLKEFVPQVATNLEYAVLSAGWYWNKNNINQYADKDDLGRVSAAINHPKSLNKIPFNTDSLNGMKDRKDFCTLLKIIFNYENCKK
jgi:predicted chitinase